MFKTEKVLFSVWEYDGNTYINNYKETLQKSYGLKVVVKDVIDIAGDDYAVFEVSGLKMVVDKFNKKTRHHDIVSKITGETYMVMLGI